MSGGIVASILSEFDDRGVKNAQKSFAELEGFTAKAGYGFEKAFLPAVAALSAVGVAVKSGISAASDLNEQINKTQVVFGDSSTAILAWSQTTAESLGISQRATLEATGTFGNMLIPMGIAQTSAAAMSERMVTLAADMSSFNNASPEETLQALQSGLAGETEPLRKFGVFLNQARIEQVALNDGLWNGKGNIDAAAKAAATYSIILQDTKAAQGDFARTSNGLANEQRILAAEVENAKAAFGKLFLPVLKAIMPILNQMANYVAENSRLFSILAIVIAAVASAVIFVNGAMKAYEATAKAAVIITNILRASMLGLPVFIVVAALAALVTAFVILYKKSETFREAVGNLGEWAKWLAKILGDVLVKAVQLLTWEYGTFISYLGKGLSLLGFLSPKFSKLGDSLQNAGNAVKHFGNSFGDMIDGLGSKLPGLLKAGASIGGDIVQGATDKLSNDLPKGLVDQIAAAGASNPVKSAAKKAGDNVKTALSDSLGGAFGTFSDKALRAYDAETNALTDKLKSQLNVRLAAVEDALTASSDRIRASLNATLKTLSAQEAQLTPAEKAYKDSAAARDKERALRELADAEQAVTDAQLSGDEKAVQKAQQDLSDILTNRAIDALQAQADEERRIKTEQYQQMRDDAAANADKEIKDLEASAAAKKKQLEDETDDAILQLTAERDLRREFLDEQLNDIEENLKKHPALYQKYHDDLMRLFADSFGPDYSVAGSNLGLAFARGLDKSQTAVAAAAARLAAVGSGSVAPSATSSAPHDLPLPGITVNVNAGIGTNGAQVGAQVLNVLRDYSKQNGSIGFGVGIG